jgi:dolichol-phosphate mannosyltransferase
MKIAFVCSQFPPTKSGYANIASALSTCFEKLGHEVDIVTERGRGCSRGRGKVAVLDDTGKRLLAREHDVVQIIGPTPLFSEQCVKYVRKTSGERTKIVYTMNAFPGLSSYSGNPAMKLVDHIYKRFYLKRWLKRVDCVVFNTEDYARYFSLYRGRYEVIPYGFEWRDGLSRVARAESSSKNILFVGQLRHYKGIPCLIRAFRELRDMNVDARLEIVGEGPDGEKLRNFAQELHVSDRVEIRSGVSDEELDLIYSRADVFVLPSIREPESFGIVLLEAGSRGVPLVASALPGVRELATSLGGITFPPNDSHALALAIDRVLKGDGRREEAQVTDVDYSRYIWETIAREYVSLYGKLLNLQEPSVSGKTVAALVPQKAEEERACVVIPTYNERRNIRELVSECISEASALEGMDIHALVVDDNSPDGTADVVRELAQADHRVHLLSRGGKMGLGSAYVDGFRWALSNLNPSIFVQMDADFSHPPEVLPRLLEEVRAGYQVAIASRYIRGGGSDGWPLHRKMISRGANLLARSFLRLHVKDATGEYRALSRSAVLEIVNSRMGARGYDYAIEALLLLKLSNFSMSEVPYVFKQRKAGKAKLAPSDIFMFAGRVAKLTITRRLM